MSTTDKNLTKTRITSNDQIKVGMLVAFVVGQSTNAGKVIMSRGFIRSISGNTARIGDYLVPVDSKFIRWHFTK